MRRSTTMSILAAFMASNVLLTATGCGGGADAGQATPPAATAPYSGEDVFRGLFFAQGAVGHALSDLLGPRGAPAELTAAQFEHAVARMKADGWSQTTIDRVQAALDAVKRGEPLPETSPDQVTLVRDAIVAQIRETDPTFFERFGVAMQSGDQVQVEAAFGEARDKVRKAVDVTGRATGSPGIESTCLVLVVVVAVAVAVVLWLWTWASHEDEHPTGSRLGRDELIQALTLRLARS